ncbi:hypothetical protein NDU88_001293 [Pleurodeles waltl]|uniref:Uncharacterized protein n=1 Tax=Pleurodeles waltl TaxID=8319 RepID=A0AAV7KT38_PLEWA|nr:hypothetical protein NDU88_001293 [Pleurodeles waltl]
MGRGAASCSFIPKRGRNPRKCSIPGLPARDWAVSDGSLAVFLPGAASRAQLGISEEGGDSLAATRLGTSSSLHLGVVALSSCLQADVIAHGAWCHLRLAHLRNDSKCTPSQARAAGALSDRVLRCELFIASRCQ